MAQSVPTTLEGFRENHCECRSVAAARQHSRTFSASGKGLNLRALILSPTLSERVHEFVLLPERLPFFPKLNALGNERLAVWILRACLIGADEFLVLAMGEHDAIESVDDDIEIAIGEWAALLGNVGIGLCTVRLDGR